jgi:hypothetical protein
VCCSSTYPACQRMQPAGLCKIEENSHVCRYVEALKNGVLFKPAGRPFGMVLTLVGRLERFSRKSHQHFYKDLTGQANTFVNSVRVGNRRLSWAIYSKHIHGSYPFQQNNIVSNMRFPTRPISLFVITVRQRPKLRAKARANEIKHQDKHLHLPLSQHKERQLHPG